MNANEMRKITEVKIEERKQTMIKKCDEYIENEIAPRVKKCAECGYRLCTLARNYSIAYDYIIEKLTKLGYEVKIENRNIIIAW